MRHLCLGEIEGSYHFYVPKHMRLGGEAVFCLPGGLLVSRRKPGKLEHSFQETQGDPTWISGFPYPHLSCIPSWSLD